MGFQGFSRNVLANQGGLIVGLTGGAGGARKIRKLIHGGVVGSTEPRNMLGMLVVMPQSHQASIGAVKLTT